MDGKTEVSDSVLSKEHVNAVLIALFVTVLWASSWVIIKFGLEEIPPLTFAGLRYVIAAGILMSIIASKRNTREEIQKIDRRSAGLLVGYGVVFVAVTQGAQFVGLDLLDAIAVSLLLNMTPLIVLVSGIVILKEIPSHRQMGFILLGIGGVLIYFYPLELEIVQIVGVLVVLGGVIANAFSSIIGRAINKEQKFSPIIVTGTSMFAGAIILLIVGVLTEGVRSLSVVSMIYILWLSVVNTALAFTLWNRAMQTLRAVDISIINSMMLPQIVILSIVFLGEMPDILDWIGLIILAVSVLVVQVMQARRIAHQE